MSSQGDEELELEDRWYWDRRNSKAYYPTEVHEDGTVTFTTVWHPEEVADAMEGGALVPAEEVGLERVNTTFDLLDSFRFDRKGVEDGE
jgi:hypothetical protein